MHGGLPAGGPGLASAPLLPHKTYRVCGAAAKGKKWFVHLPNRPQPLVGPQGNVMPGILQRVEPSGRELLTSYPPKGTTTEIREIPTYAPPVLGTA